MSSSRWRRAMPAAVCGACRVTPLPHRGPGRSRRALTIEVLDGDPLAPADLVAGQPEDGGDRVAVLGAGRPPTKHDCRDPLLVHARPLGDLPGIDPVLGAEFGDTPGCVHRPTPLVIGPGPAAPQAQPGARSLPCLVLGAVPPDRGGTPPAGDRREGYPVPRLTVLPGAGLGLDHG